MILNIDDYTKPEKPKLYIASPNRTIVGELPEAYNIKLNTKLGNVFTLEFSIPYKITRLNELIDNPNIKKTKNRYLIKLVYGINVEWFMIKTPSDIMDDTDHKDIQCYGLAYELADKNVRNYEVTSKNVTQILTDILASSLWTIGSVDADFDVMYRSLSITDSNVLDVIFEMATTFDALVTFDSINRKVNFVQFLEYGNNRGREVSYGNLLKSATKSESTDEFFTLFKGFGADGIGIQGVNVTGSNYLFDVSFFMYPFARDNDNNVLSHSDYMSDSLCHALLDYSELLESSKGTYQGYLSSLESLRQTIITKQNELSVLQDELVIIEDEIAVANYNNQSTASLVAQKNAKIVQINSKKSEIATVQTSIDNVNNNITALQDTLSMDANFTIGQLEELNPYIIEGSYENTNITSSQQLYDILVKEFEKVKQPKIVVEIGMVNLLEVAEEKKKWDMLRLGDTIRVKNTRVGIDVSAKIIELNFDFESGEISTVISNIKELLSDEARYLRDLYNARTTTTNVISKSGLWNQAADEASEAQQILNGVWDATARQIQASVDNTVDIGRKGVIVSDPNTPNDILILQKGLLAISKNGGDTWSTAINASGVFAERLVGQILIGTNLTISNSSGSVNINANGMTVTDMTLSIINSTVKSKVLINATDGFKIQKNTGTTGSPIWSDQISLDVNGNALFGGILSIGSGNNIIKADPSIGLWVGASTYAASPFRVSLTGAITASNVALTGGSLGWGSFNISSSGVLTATGANISGNVTANSLVAGAFISSPIINGGYIATSSTYPRTEMTATNNMFGVYASATNYLTISPTLYGAPTIRFDDGSVSAQMRTFSGADFYFEILSNSKIHLRTGNGNNQSIRLQTGALYVPAWAQVFGGSSGSLQDALDSVANRPAKFA